MEWTDWCRLCGKEKGNQIDIFIKNEDYSSISETIEKYFLVTINSYDQIPTKICSSCNEFLLTLLTFSDITNKVQQMFLELDYLIKLDNQINLTELRIKYGIENFCAIKSNPNVLTREKLILKSENDTDLISIQKKKNTRNLKKYSFNPTKKDDLICVKDSSSILNKASADIKCEIDKVENIIEYKDELKKEHDSKSDENIDDSSSNYEQHSDNNDTENNTEYVSPLVQNIHAVKVKEIQNKRLRNKKRTYNIQKDENPKRVKKKYRDEEKRIQCEICSMKFVRENNLSAHLKKVHKIVKEIPPCEYCGKICKTKQKLKFHRELHLPLEERQKLLFKCPECGQKFTQKGAMRSHIRGTHSHERPFVCEACGKAFTSQSNLWAHRRKTHEENMMPCEICQKICKNTSSLRRHMSTHKEPSIPCSVCGILLKTKKTLKNHMLVHSDIKAFQCNYCGKEFKRDITLQLHMIIHSGLKPYVCRFCEQTYANPSNCKKHEKHSHPTEYQAAEGTNGPSQPQRIIKKLPNIKQLKAMLEDMKAAKENN